MCNRAALISDFHYKNVENKIIYNNYIIVTCKDFLRKKCLQSDKSLTLLMLCYVELRLITLYSTVRQFISGVSQPRGCDPLQMGVIFLLGGHEKNNFRG